MNHRPELIILTDVSSYSHPQLERSVRTTVHINIKCRQVLFVAIVQWKGWFYLWRTWHCTRIFIWVGKWMLKQHKFFITTHSLKKTNRKWNKLKYMHTSRSSVAVGRRWGSLKKPINSTLIGIKNLLKSYEILEKLTFSDISRGNPVPPMKDAQVWEDVILLSRCERGLQPKATQFIDISTTPFIFTITKCTNKDITSWNCWLQGGFPVAISMIVQPTLQISAGLKTTEYHIAHLMMMIETETAEKRKTWIDYIQTVPCLSDNLRSHPIRCPLHWFCSW